MTTFQAGPLLVVDGPPPLPPVYGLLQAASAPPVRIIADADAEGIERWLAGVKLRPYPADQAGVFDAGTLCGSAPQEKEAGDSSDLDTPVFGPFTVYLPVSCKARAMGDQAAFRARAVAALVAVEGAAVERVLLNGAGELSQPFLADGDAATPNSNTTTSPVNGLALLEDEIAASERQGVIHASPATVTLWRSLQLVEDRGGVLKTILGTVVIPGDGYRGHVNPIGHSGAGTTKEWAYATGPIDVRRTDVEVLPDNVRETLDRSTNEVVYRAERHYVVAWDTVVQSAVLIDRCKTTC